jgi:drug/metabolite transporter (DMT)-like permease
MRFERPGKEYLMVFIAAVLFGSVGVFVRWTDLPGQEMVVVFWRMLIGAAFYLAVILATRSYKAFRLGNHPVLLLSSGVVLTFLWICSFKAINLLPLSDAVFISYLAPVLVALAAPFFLKEKLERNTIVALFLAVGGVALLSLTQKSDGSGSFNALGLLYAGLTAVLIAVLLLVLKKLREDTPTLTITFYQTATGVILIAPLMPFQHYTITAKGWASLAVLGIVHVGIAGLLYVYAARKVKAQHLGIISYIEPVSTIFYGWFLLSETPGWQDLLGGLLIVVAGLVIFLRPSSGVETEPL